jgi:hypothetical protein
MIRPSSFIPMKFNIKIASIILRNYTIDHLDHLSNLWINGSYNSNNPKNLGETEEQWKLRKDRVIPLIIQEKLRRYEDNI